MWRHGDVFIEACNQIPKGAKRLPHLLLAKGELTGHAHRIEGNRGASLFEAGDERFLDVTDDSITIIHEEHAPITLTRGAYRVWIQREYSPDAIHRVMD